MEILGLVPARAGSERVKNKNIRLLGNQPLIAYTISCALKSKLLTKVVVSTDSVEIAEIAKDFGAEVPFLRPAEISTSYSTELEFHHHALSALEKQCNFIPDLIVNLYPTCPFRKSSSIDRAIALLLENHEFDSLRSVTPCTEHPYKMWIKENKEIKPFVQSSDYEKHTLSYQMLPKVYIQNACIYISRYQTIMEKGSTLGDKILGFEMDQKEALDINNELDFKLASSLLVDMTSEMYF